MFNDLEVTNAVEKILYFFGVIGIIGLMIVGLFISNNHKKSTSSEGTEDYTYILSGLGINNFIFDMESYEGKHYILMDKGVARLENDSLNYLYKTDMNIEDHSDLAVGEERIIFTKKAEKLIYCLSMNGALIETISWDLLDQKDMTDIAEIKIKDNYLWILARTDNYYNDILLSLNMENKSVNKVLEDKLFSFDFISDDKFIFSSFIMEEYKTILCEYNLNSKVSKRLMDFSDEIASIWDIKYDAEKNRLVFLSDEGLLEVDLKEKSYKNIFHNRYAEEGRRILSFSLGTPFLAFNGTELFELQKAPKKTTTLVILDNKEGVGNILLPNFQAAIREIRKEDDSVECSKMLVENYDETLVKKLLSKHKDFDIFLVRIQDIKNLNPEFLQVIDEIPVVQDTNNILLSGIVKASCVNGRQIGIPADLWVECWGIDSNLAGELEFDPKESIQWTWDDFLEEAAKHRKDINHDGKADIWLSDWTGPNIVAYIYETSSGTSPLAKEEWRNILIKIKEAQDKGIIIREEEKLAGEEGRFILEYSDLHKYVADHHEADYVFFPNIDPENPVYILDGWIYCINPYSDKIDLAARLLCEAIKPQNYIPTNSSILHNNNAWYNEYNDDEIIWAKQISFDDESFSKYSHVINHAIPKSKSLYETPLYDLVIEYFGNKADVDLVAEELIKSYSFYK